MALQLFDTIEQCIVEGRSYRFCDSSASSQSQNLGSYEEETYEPIVDFDEDVDDDNIEIVSHTGGRYMHAFHVPRVIFSHIIGSKGTTKKRLEAETKTTIHVPKVGQDGDISSDRRSIVSARNRIQLLVESSRRKIQFTHFLSIPLNCESVVRGFNEFKKDVLNITGKGARGVNESIFQGDSRLHLTLDVLKLLDDDERKIATKKLHDCKKDIIDSFLEKNGPINVEIKGVECMNDEPNEVKVLYAIIVDSDGCLQTLAEDVVKYFAEDDLINRKYNRVKLHMTIMNTKFGLKEDSEALKGKWNTFDASNILKVHKDTYFGKMTISTIHLSQRHTRGEFGYYKATAKIDF